MLRHSRPCQRFTLLGRRMVTINCCRYMARFFAPSEADENNASTLREATQNSSVSRFVNYSRNLTRFLDPNTFYPEVEITDPSIIENVLDITYEPFKSWKEICRANLTNSAKVGSFIEFIENNEIHFGVVLREPYTRFNPYHNRTIVLTLNNDLIKVCPQDITFSLYKVLDSESINAQEILASRYNESYLPRAKLVQALHQFMAIANKNKKSVAHALKCAHSNLADESKAAPVCLADLTKFIMSQTHAELPSYFHESAFLMAIHLEMCKDCSRWMVPGLILSRRTTNLSSYGSCSNTIPPPPIIFATPVAILDDIQNFLNFSHKEMAEFNNLLEDLSKTPQKFDDLVLQFVIWDAKRFKSALKTMMYAVVHPHPQITKKLMSMPIFKAQENVGVEAILRQIGLYNNPQNPLTDPFLTSGIFGAVKKHSLIASSSKDLYPSNVSLSASEDANKNEFVDNFPHLRNSRSYFHDTTAYILPGIRHNIAISMEEINSRRFFINIHVADFASRLVPSSATFSKWSENNAFLEKASGLPEKKSDSLFPCEATRETLFTNPRSRNQNDLFVAGNVSEKLPRRSKGDRQTCMTITFEYNSYLEEPMKNISETVAISFDSLFNFQLKAIEPSVLEESLTGRLEPSIFKKLKLFGRREPNYINCEKPLEPEDHYSLNFIYNAFRRHFEARNRNHAVSLAQCSRPKEVIKSLTVKEGTDAIETRLMLSNESQALDKSKFLRSEAEIIAGRLVGYYAHKNAIPVFYDIQELLSETEVGMSTRDEVLIRHDNVLHPDFSAASYSQVAYGRDVSGYVTTPAFKFASNFLGLEVTSTNSKNASPALGIRNGTVNVVDATESMKAYINQLQILHHVHFTHTANAQLFNHARKFSHLKALGYSLHGALSKSTIDAFGDRFVASSMCANYLAARHRRYWVLKTVEQNPRSFDGLRCVVTQFSKYIEISIDANGDSASQGALNFEGDESRLQMVRAYCEKLGIEVDLLVEPNHVISVGSEIITSQVLHVDPVSEIIIMG